MIEYSTFSIVAVDTDTGELGSAIASCALAAGFAVPHFNLHGVVHTQHHASPSIAAHILSNITNAGDPTKAIQLALSNDLERESRQLLCITLNGAGATFTGSECKETCHQFVGRNFVAGGNTLASKQVINAMAEAFSTAKDHPMSFRLLAALVAGEAIGGDQRGKQSASLRVVNPRDQERWYLYPDLRVDDHRNPLDELSRLHEIFIQKKRRWN